MPVTPIACACSCDRRVVVRSSRRRPSGSSSATARRSRAMRSPGRSPARLLAERSRRRDTAREREGSERARARRARDRVRIARGRRRRRCTDRARRAHAAPRAALAHADRRDTSLAAPRARARRGAAPDTGSRRHTDEDRDRLDRGAREITPRGWYASPVGWFDLEGNGELAVAIRSGLLAERAHLWAGAGIVAGSDPDRELAETDVKLRAMLGALGVSA